LCGIIVASIAVDFSQRNLGVAIELALAKILVQFWLKPVNVVVVSKKPLAKAKGN
jgi:hypothetical protein